MFLLDILEFIKASLNEDMPNGDVTSDNTILEDSISEANLIAKEEGIISGIDLFKMVFEYLGDVTVNDFVKNGDHVNKGDIIAALKGNTRNMLKGERVALNILQRMSGVATLTRKYVDEIDSSSKTKILDTRKTTPLLRYFEKRAVKDGGGVNHRYSLSDMVMIKDNHIKGAGSIKKAVERVLDCGLKIEVEVENLEMFKEALDTKCDIIMLDNMTNEQMAECLKYNTDKQIEASGNMTIERINSVSKLNVDFISVGALTHSYSSLDISLKFK